jgi:hypothetical protein
VKGEEGEGDWGGGCRKSEEAGCRRGRIAPSAAQGPGTHEYRVSPRDHPSMRPLSNKSLHGRLMQVRQGQPTKVGQRSRQAGDFQPSRRSICPPTPQRREPLKSALLYACGRSGIRKENDAIEVPQGLGLA